MDLGLWATIRIALLVFSLTVGLEVTLRTKAKTTVKDSLLVGAPLLAVLTGLEMSQSYPFHLGLLLSVLLGDIGSYAIYYVSGMMIGVLIYYIETRKLVAKSALEILVIFAVIGFVLTVFASILEMFGL